MSFADGPEGGRMTASVDNLGPLLSAARSGSVDALGQMLEAHRAYLLHVANQELASDLQAKGGGSDLVQETFLEAHQDFARFQGSTEDELLDRKSTRLNSSHLGISYAVFCLTK